MPTSNDAHDNSNENDLNLNRIQITLDNSPPPPYSAAIGHGDKNKLGFRRGLFNKFTQTTKRNALVVFLVIGLCVSCVIITVMGLIYFLGKFISV
jgi:hypothetical protein